MLKYMKSLVLTKLVKLSSKLNVVIKQKKKGLRPLI